MNAHYRLVTLANIIMELPGDADNPDEAFQQLREASWNDADAIDKQEETLWRKLTDEEKWVEIDRETYEPCQTGPDQDSLDSRDPVP